MNGIAAAQDFAAASERARLTVAKRKLVLPLAIFMAAVAAYVFCTVLAVLANDVIAKIAFGVLAGVFIANLAIIGHDAAHRSFTRVRWLNRVIGTIAFLPALHPFGRWEYHHNQVHHCYTAQIGVDNAYSPMTPEQYRAASRVQRLYYRFMRSLLGQPFFYMIDIWLPNMFLPYLKSGHSLRMKDWLDITLVYVWLGAWVLGLAALACLDAHIAFKTALVDSAVFGVAIPFLVWNLFISFVTIVQHTGPRVRWLMPTGRFSTHQQKLDGTVHVALPEVFDWFFHRVMQHLAHHANPVIPMYALKQAEKEVMATATAPLAVETWTPLYHWRLARDCKLYDPKLQRWCGYGDIAG
jgi:omega-6 fatty acid desaturase (delta-12 desaturase)